MSNPTYELKLDMNVLNHLGINLYSSIPAVLSELVANAWDADAKEIHVTIDKKDNDEDSVILLKDDGIGMSEEDLNKKFLLVGYQRRRNKKEDRTPNLKRKVMGSKGIGKLSVFSIADDVRIYTKKKDQEVLGLRLNVKDLRKAISEGEPYNPEVLDKPPKNIILGKTGTTIELLQLKKKITASQIPNLRQRVANRFSAQLKGFAIFLNERKITIEDKRSLSELEYVRIYGAYPPKLFKHIVGSDRKQVIKERIDPKHDYEINGWIGLAKSSGTLREESINKVSVLVRGKMVIENIIDDIEETSLYVEFLAGEIEADFLDITGEADIITSSRQDLVREDNRYILLKEYITKQLKEIKVDRNKYKMEEAEADIKEKIPEMNEWYAKLRGDDRKHARKLFGNIHQIAMDEEHKLTLYYHAILAFEKLSFNEKLNQLDNIKIEQLEEVIKLFESIDDIEESFYYQITKGRLDVIKKLAGESQKNAKEKVLQKYISKHLWLLDPSWDRATEVPETERPIKLNNITGESNQGRIDILYKKITGKYIIIELKRPNIFFKHGIYDLGKQASKYSKALKNELRARQEGNLEIEIICIVGDQYYKDIYDNNDKDEVEGILNPLNMRIITYSDLIKNAKKSYQDYLEEHEEIDSISQVIKALEKSRNVLSQLPIGR